MVANEIYFFFILSHDLSLPDGKTFLEKSGFVFIFIAFFCNDDMTFVMDTGHSFSRRCSKGSHFCFFSMWLVFLFWGGIEHSIID